MQSCQGGGVDVEGVGEVVWVYGGVGCWVGGGEVHGSARQGVFEDGEEGEVVGWVEGGVGAVEEAGVVGVRGGGAAWEVEFLNRGFLGVEELLDGEEVFFGMS